MAETLVEALLEQQLMGLLLDDDDAKTPSSVAPAPAPAAAVPPPASSPDVAAASSCAQQHAARKLSASAPEFVPQFKALPHVISVFDAATYHAHTMKCDLATLKVSDIVSHVDSLGLTRGRAYSLLVSGKALATDTACLGTDVGLSNGSVVVFQSTAAAPAAAATASLLADPAADSSAAGHFEPCILGRPASAVPALERTSGSATPPNAQGTPSHQTPPLQESKMSAAAATPASAAAAAASANTPSPAMQHMIDLMLAQVSSHSPTSAGNGSASSASGNVTPNSSLTSFATPCKTGGLFDTSPEMTPSRSLESTLTPSTMTPSVLMASPPSSAGSPLMTQTRAMKPLRMQVDPYSSVGSHQLVSTLLSCQGMGGVYREAVDMCCEDMVEMAQDHNASKVILSLVETAHRSDIQRLLEPAYSHLSDIIRSVSGSEVLVALVTSASAEGVDARSLTTGTPLLIDMMAKHSVEVCSTIPGRKLVQIAVVKYRDDQKAPFYQAVCRDLIPIALDQCGCITLQRMYDYALTTPLKQLLRETIMVHLTSLVCDPFGNYVLQHVVRDNRQMAERVIFDICPRLGKIACNKFGSNVLEKSLVHGTERAKVQLIMCLCDREVMETLVKDAYGNYVIQTAVEHCPTNLMEHLRAAIHPVVDSSPYSYRIEGKLQKRMKKKTAPRGSNFDAPCNNAGSNGNSNAAGSGAGVPVLSLEQQHVLLTQQHQLQQQQLQLQNLAAAARDAQRSTSEDVFQQLSPSHAVDAHLSLSHDMRQPAYGSPITP